jgi:hypothetical protein
MTGEDPSFLSATPDQVERGVAREIRKHLPVLDARDTAAIAMVPVRPVLEAKDAEIERLREQWPEWLCGPCATIHPWQKGDRFTVPCPRCGSAMVPTSASRRALDAAREEAASARADERAQCARHLRDQQMWAAANTIDPLGPLQGAPAKGS